MLFRLLLLCLVSLCLHVSSSTAQTLPANRAVDWSVAGLRPDTLTGLVRVDMQAYGAVGDGITPNDQVIGNFLATFFGLGAILEFPSGTFVFNQTIQLPSNFILRGQGPDSTTFLMDLGGSGSSILISGQQGADTSFLQVPRVKGSSVISVWDASNFQAGDWIRLRQYDTDLVTSSWAEETVGQIVEIDSIVGNQLWLHSPLRMNYDTARQPYIQKLNPVKNVGIECLKIKRLDNTAPSQTSNVHFRYAVNCWVTGIESDQCTFAHVLGDRSSNLYVAGCYLHHAFGYGGGGRAYGVVFQMTTGECLAENNIFEHLRHSILLQAGANGNVLAYNFSTDPYWDNTPNNAAGDIALHGNYIYANLFEQNIVQNIVIDNSHGPNGPHNTFLRNRGSLFGIFFSATNSPEQNFLGNEVPNTSFPYSLVNYNLQGAGHFEHGNNDKGTIKPAGTQALSDLSYYYSSRPSFVPPNQWAAIGTPNVMGSGSIPAADRFAANNLFAGFCSSLPLPIVQLHTQDWEGLSIYPNPTSDQIHLKASKPIQHICIYNQLGQLMENYTISNQKELDVDLSGWLKGLYILEISYTDGSQESQRVVKS